MWFAGGIELPVENSSEPESGSGKVGYTRRPLLVCPPGSGELPRALCDNQRRMLTLLNAWIQELITQMSLVQIQPPQPIPSTTDVDAWV